MEKTTETPTYFIFAIFDTKANSYRDALNAQSEWDLLRDYEKMCRDEKGQQSDLVNNAEDFQLFSIGAYYKTTGSIVGWLPRHVANLHQVKASVLRKNPVKDVLDLDKVIKQDARFKGIPSETNASAN
jgi:hypothetical protein